MSRGKGARSARRGHELGGHASLYQWPSQRVIHVSLYRMAGGWGRLILGGGLYKNEAKIFVQATRCGLYYGALYRPKITVLALFQNVLENRNINPFSYILYARVGKEIHFLSIMFFTLCL